MISSFFASLPSEVKRKVSAHVNLETYFINEEICAQVHSPRPHNPTAHTAPHERPREFVRFLTRPGCFSCAMRAPSAWHCRCAT